MDDTQVKAIDEVVSPVFVRLVGIEGKMTTMGAGAIVMTSVAVPVPYWFDAEIVILVVPAVVGIPVTRPVAVTESPGMPEALYEVGLCDAVIWYENDVPT